MWQTVPCSAACCGMCALWRARKSVLQLTASREYALMVGSGVKGQGGNVLVYRSKHINKGDFMPDWQCSQQLRANMCSPLALVALLHIESSALNILEVGSKAEITLPWLHNYKAAVTT